MTRRSNLDLAPVRREVESTGSDLIRYSAGPIRGAEYGKELGCRAAAMRNSLSAQVNDRRVAASLVGRRTTAMGATRPSARQAQRSRIHPLRTSELAHHRQANLLDGHRLPSLHRARRVAGQSAEVGHLGMSCLAGNLIPDPATSPVWRLAGSLPLPSAPRCRRTVQRRSPWGAGARIARGAQARLNHLAITLP